MPFAFEHTTLIHLSALAEPKSEAGIPASMRRLFNANLARQWPSIQAFAELFTAFAPASMKSSPCCYGLFSHRINSIAWALYYLDWAPIAQYQSGELNTHDFLDRLIRTDFSFLNDLTFAQFNQYTHVSLQQLYDHREAYVSLSNLQDFDDLTTEDLAKVLLERAWLARMQFDNPSDVQYFFDQNKKNRIYIFANTNEMDLTASLRHLKAIYPQRGWLDKPHIHVPKKPHWGSIFLTKDGSVQLYASYTHHAPQTTVQPATPALLKSILLREDIDVTKTTLISPWQDDRDMAQTLNIQTVLDANTYFQHKSNSPKLN
jgi:hypothetical protein